MNQEKAILAGGCFWGMEELFRSLPGVINTHVGYAGGDLANPTYNDIKTGMTGHAESLEVIFDTSQTDFRSILQFFFQIHDPSTLNRQGNDRGTQYRSAIFAQNDIQKKIAEEVIESVNASGKWPGPVTTEIVTGGVFYEAEGFHQEYLQKNPHGYTCHWIRQEWKI